ncbi:hypothetical protein DWB61_05840 [Ancylomarina euxinus]|uniref:DUF4199 domain-containing protein n=1 Tax=Ancylomarina euxinus TaxID=2283627 RepID=A0A425Y3X4_9BACT|nr:hypothetical protein [Ancylomarina euxinus]MCZ4694559.1 hypothetical protein [Ancylomarina euxinus]MUP14102.1 hypothetical protein [Ancylomarina euxinus]RRG22959.1 hypothetical protein DWB61_05840 [Ancylomarina euxinus]
MEILTKIISFLGLGGLIASPIVILYRLNKRNVKYTFLAYLTLGLIITASIVLAFAWWADISNKILLSHYGYDFDAWNDTDRFTNVTKENMARVKSLESNMLGIGWPLKAILFYIFYSPYLLLVFLITYIVKRNKIKNIHLTKAKFHGR